MALLQFAVDPFKALDRLVVLARAQEGPLKLTLPGFPMRKITIIGTLETARNVLIKNADHYQKGPVLGILSEFLGNGLLTAEGDAWKKQRDDLAPYFLKTAWNSPILQARMTQTVIDAWASVQNQKEAFELGDFLKKLSLKLLFDGILSPLYLKEGEALPSRDVQNGDVQNGNVMNDWIYLTQKINLYFAKALTPVGLLTPKIIRLKRAALLKGELVQLLKQTPLKDPNTDPTQFFTLIMAGHETTASVLTWTLARKCLARECLARDTLRDTPPVWAIVREHKISKELVIIPVAAIQRFEPEASHSLAFGMGPRACIGAGFAQATIKLVLDHTPKELKLAYPEQTLTLTPKAGLSCSPREAIWVTAHPSV